MSEHRLRTAGTIAGLGVGALLLSVSAAYGTSTSSPAPAGSTSNARYDVSASTVDGADWDEAELAGIVDDLVEQAG